MKKKSVSVVIPTYNYARYLRGALDSVLAQEADVALDIIVVDDGSTDDTAKVLGAYRDRVRVVSQANRGLSAARNRGIAEAGGDFFVFLDSDDLLAPGAVAGQMAFLDRNPDCDVAVSPSAFFSETREGRPVEAGRWNLFADDLDIHLCHFNIAPPHAFMIRRKAMGGLCFDETLGACEDHWFWLGLLASGAVFRANPNALVHYRRHAQSMSADTLRQHRHDALMHRRIFDLLEQRPVGLRSRLGLRYLACCTGALWTLRRICCQCPQEAGDLALVATGCLDRMDVPAKPSELSCWLTLRAWDVLKGMDGEPLVRGLGDSLARRAGQAPPHGDSGEMARQKQIGLHLAATAATSVSD
ncbi:MAG: glycosyltransferase [Pseudodesulfovibrio sp.]|uniref:Glycosyl transferase family 2 n=1 Tax=Pseudodesulfovibrio aespoeensis (strain ATCC 700646 / DSM 10631 / Aspo-2) TaxID=643562 RepID=E6VUI3_PSEA9|nr:MULTISPECIES: glycosyltransferase [Pseudodesulfovibrio]MBU4244279.1 glycosyltransferase [Pseudomonadota bacterium]ADU61128.1 glycosyl transferase family 2 [Pseudodesulfovibrio aespoeensis Aspo-2]MBU4379187.1 glycosyltransferase [Pseudomonadota bacterium]MBU4476743.1 glycosyltransferase [Pseudomonadota bacterium]MBU4517065.1 glycosyltransferase [Pseudomonadota bacterium]